MSESNLINGELQGETLGETLTDNLGKTARTMGEDPECGDSEEHGNSSNVKPVEPPAAENKELTWQETLKQLFQKR